MKHLRSHSFVINRKDGPTAILVSTDNFIKLNKLLRLLLGVVASFLIVKIIFSKLKNNNISE